MAHAIDRELLIKTVVYGYGTVCYSPIAPGLKEFHDPTPSPYTLDLKKAEALLDEAGFPRGANKVRFKVPLDYNPIGDESRRACEFMRSALGRIGIAVEVRAADPSAFVKRVYTDREFDFTYNGHSNLFDPTVGVQRIYWSKNFKKGVPFSNGSHYDNPKVDALLEGAAVENDPVKRKADVHRVPEDHRRGSARHPALLAALPHHPQRARARPLADRRRRRGQHGGGVAGCLEPTSPSRSARSARLEGWATGMVRDPTLRDGPSGLLRVRWWWSATMGI